MCPIENECDGKCCDTNEKCVIIVSYPLTYACQSIEPSCPEDRNCGNICCEENEFCSKILILGVVYHYLAIQLVHQTLHVVKFVAKMMNCVILHLWILQKFLVKIKKSVQKTEGVDRFVVLKVTFALIT
eukprot:00119.XXX_2_528_1 [CDS] Oithona nana genome sequencing.